MEDDIQDERVVRVQDVPVPEGWSLDTVDVLLELPPEYPYTPPAMFVSEELEVDDGLCSLYWDCDRDGWKQINLAFLLENWDPTRHGTRTVVRYFKARLHCWKPDDPKQGGAEENTEL